MSKFMTDLAFEDPSWRNQFVEFAVKRTGIPAQRVSHIVETCAAEVAVGEDLIAKSLTPAMRILEVGAGIGLLSHRLKLRGLNIVALEPGASGFSDNARVGKALQEYLATEGFTMLDREASTLTPAKDGCFDLIFSVNVLEHIPDLEGNIAAMTRVLGPGGVMLHTCPNYTVPYEPHYALPLVPGFPQAVTWLRPSLRDETMWQSLNFVTAGRIKKIAKSLDLNVRFRRGLLFDALSRMDSDPEFATRHPHAFRTALAALRTAGLIGLLRHVPATLSTPMTFALTRRPEGYAP